MFLFFFFKQKTAYEMRISDWSSDVCSSDLFMGSALPLRGRSGQPIELGAGIVEHLKGIDQFAARFEQRALGIQDVQVGELALPIRSEERRVGKECVSTCRSRWSPYH